MLQVTIECQYPMVLLSVHLPSLANDFHDALSLQRDLDLFDRLLCYSAFFSIQRNSPSFDEVIFSICKPYFSSVFPPFKDTEVLELVTIRDVRFGCYAKSPKVSLLHSNSVYSTVKNICCDRPRHERHTETCLPDTR